MARSAARRYADAIVSLAREKGNFDAWERDLSTLAQALSDPRARRFFTNPGVPVAQKRRVFDSLLSGALLETRNLVDILMERQRLAILPDLYLAFSEARLAEQGIVVAEVTTAEPLGPGDQRMIQDRLHGMTGKRVELRLKVDPDIMGGLVARVGDQLLDGSVRTKLRELRGRLLAGA